MYEVENAFRTLFGEEITFSLSVLQYIQPSGIKSAYREQVKLCHPDMVKGHDVNETDQNTLFQKVHDSYKLLMQYKENKLRVSEFPGLRPHQRTGFKKSTKNYYKKEYKKATKPSQAKEAEDFFCTLEKLPGCRLRLGEFLYYSKVISWKTLIHAIVFSQRSENKKLGNYFVENRILSQAKLTAFLKEQVQHNRQFNS